jgi:hypothetical protein
MHELVMRIKDADRCHIFAQNAIERGHPELAIESHRRAVDIRAEQHAEGSEAEQMAMRAFFAYEEALSYQHGKRKRATGTWQLVNRHGILPALLKRLESKSVEEMLPVLKELNMEDYSIQKVASTYADDIRASA